MDRKGGILVKMFKIFFISLFSTSSTKFIEFDAGNLNLFQIKVSGRNIKETTTVGYFIKVTACHSFPRLRAIRPINGIH